MKQRLVLVLNEYPYNPGEYSFIKTELSLLVEHFEVIIISVSPNDKQCMVVDDRIKLYHCVRRFGLKEKLQASLGFLLWSHGRREIIKIISERKLIIGRLYDALSYYCCAQQLWRFTKKMGVFDSQGHILVYSYWFNANCLAFLMNTPKSGIKVVSRIHGYDLYNERNAFGRQPFREYMDERIDRVFFVGMTGLEYYLTHWGIQAMDESKYSVEYIGTYNQNGMTEDNDQHEVFRLVSCSNIIPLKRIELIIETLAEIKDFSVEWIHFGMGELFDKMKEMAVDLLGNSPNISYSFEGYVSVEKIMEYYRQNWIDSFITTSSTEGCPVSVQEAMSYGIPIIATSVGEIPNMIQGNGILLSENPAIEEIKKAIYSVFECSREEIMEMRIKSRKLWESKFDASVNAVKFVKLLEDV